MAPNDDMSCWEKAHSFLHTTGLFKKASANVNQDWIAALWNLSMQPCRVTATQSESFRSRTDEARRKFNQNGTAVQEVNQYWTVTAVLTTSYTCIRKWFSCRFWFGWIVSNLF
jgi:hypothetical protein